MICMQEKTHLKMIDVYIRSQYIVSACADNNTKLNIS